jgi:hypothetical protein
MHDRLPRQLEIQGEVVLALVEAAVKGARALAAAGPLRTRSRRGQTLKPGLDTPLWNALSTAVLKQFRRRGERVRLARVLGLPRQRITEILRSRRHLPDAERTLVLLLWLEARRNGQDLA